MKELVLSVKGPGMSGKTYFLRKIMDLLESESCKVEWIGETQLDTESIKIYNFYNSEL